MLFCNNCRYNTEAIFLKNLISATDLIKKLENNEDMVLIDCRFDLIDRGYGARAYKMGHIKGAYILDVDKDLRCV